METTNYKILVIDDNSDNLIILEALLLDAFPKSTVVLASSGAEGLVLASSEKPDIILMDVLMPVMDGFEACEKLKSDDKLSDIPVVFITALMDDKESYMRGFEVGVEAFLAKPFDMDELISLISSLPTRKNTNEISRNYISNLNMGQLAEKAEQTDHTYVATLNLLEDVKAENIARRETEEALRESEVRYSSLFTGSFSVMILVDLETAEIEDVNPAACDFYGYSHEELCSKNLTEICNKSETELKKMFEECMIPGNSLHLISEHILSNGEKRNVEVNATTIMLNGKPLLYSIIEDISEKIKIQQKVEESEEKYRSLVENSPNGIGIYQEGKFVFANKAAVEILGGNSTEDIIGLPVMSVVHPDSLDVVVERVKHVAQGGAKLPPIEEKLIRIDGSVFYGKVAALSTTFNGKPAGQVIVTDITERKLLEIQKQLDNRRLECILRLNQFKIDAIQEFLDNALEEAINLTDSKIGYIYYFDEATQEFTLNSWSKEVMSHCEIMNPETLYKLEKTGIWGEAVRQRKPILINDFEAFHPHKKGYPEGLVGLKNFLTVPVFDNDKIVAVVGVANKQSDYVDSDISQLSLMMEAVWIKVVETQNANKLLESELKYRQLVENSHIGICIHQDGKFVYINQTGLSLFGATSHDEIIGKPIFSIVHPDSVEEAKKRVSLVNSGVHVLPIEHKLLRIDGSVFLAEVSSSATTYNEKPAGQVIITDITEKKAAENKLRDSEEKFREMTNLLPQIVFETDMSGNLTYINKRAYQIGGFDEINDNLVGKSCFDFFVPEDKPKLLMNIEGSFKDIKIPDNEYKMIRKDGSLLPVSIYATHVVRENHRVGLRGIIVDTTEQKNQESKIVRIARLYSFQSQINHAIVVSNSFYELFQTICDVAIQYGQLRMSWVGIYNETEKLLKPSNHAGYNENYIENLNIYPGKGSTGKGPTGIAFLEKRVVICNDIENDPLMLPWRDEALKRGYLSSFSAPIFKNNKPFAIFTLYATEKNYFNFDEQTLLQDISRNISHAVEAIESETERQLNAVALTASEQKYRELMDNSPEGITIYIDNKCVYINNNALKLIGAKDKSEVLGRDIMDFIHPVNAQAIKERMKFVAQAPVNTILHPVEEVYMRLDGTEVDVETKTMLINFDGKPAIQFVGHDITERKIIETALEQSRQELQTIYENAPVIMCVLDEDHHVIFANEAYKTFNKLTNDVIENGVRNIVFGCSNSFDDPRGCGHSKKCGSCSLNSAVASTYKTGKVHSNVEYHSVIEIDGARRSVSLLGSTSLIKTNDTKRILLCLIDISQRKQTEDALQKSEALLRSFIDNSPFEIWARDINYTGILENKKLVDHFGSIVGTNLQEEDRLDDLTLAQVKKINDRALSGEIIEQEYEFVHKNERKTFQQIVFPIKDNDNVMGIAGFNIDITEKKVAESALKQSKEELTDFASHLQVVRENERNILAREIHDDLGQILIAMKIDIGLLKQRVLKNISDEVQHKTAEQSFIELQMHVDNTLKSARRIMTDLRPDVLDLLGFTDTVTQHLKSFQERYRIKCVFSKKVKGIQLTSEQSVAMYRIVQESLNNIAKHARASEVRIKLEKQDKNIVLEIKDNGVGFNLKDPKKADSYGLLGMKERVFLLKGNLEIDSTPNVGTIIKVSVPYMKPPKSK
ncbi:MAG: PAS domain S-box protein [Paludibacter sp.]